MDSPQPLLGEDYGGGHTELAGTFGQVQLSEGGSPSPVSSPLSERVQYQYHRHGAQRTSQQQPARAVFCTTCGSRGWSDARWCHSCGAMARSPPAGHVPPAYIPPQVLMPAPPAQSQQQQQSAAGPAAAPAAGGPSEVATARPPLAPRGTDAPAAGDIGSSQQLPRSPPQEVPSSARPRYTACGGEVREVRGSGSGSQYFSGIGLRMAPSGMRRAAGSSQTLAGVRSTMRRQLRDAGWDAAFWCNLLEQRRPSVGPEPAAGGTLHRGASYRLMSIRGIAAARRAAGVLRQSIAASTQVRQDSKRVTSESPCLRGPSSSPQSSMNLASAGATQPYPWPVGNVQALPSPKAEQPSHSFPCSDVEPVPREPSPPVRDDSGEFLTGSYSANKELQYVPQSQLTGEDGAKTAEAEQTWRPESRENVLLSKDGYDLTPERLRKIFEKSRSGGAQVELDAPEPVLEWPRFRLLADGMGVQLAGWAMELLMEKLGKDPLTFDEFLNVITKLKLAELCSGSYWSPVQTDQAASVALVNTWTPLWVIDYDPDDVQPEELTERGPIRDFFFGHRKDDQSMRWVHMENPEQMNLLRCTVKYHLHPLAVEDALAKKGTKFDRYGLNYAFSCDVVQLVNLCPDDKMQERVQTVHSHICCFFAGLSGDYSTVITAYSMSKADSCSPHKDIWRELKDQLCTKHTRIKENRGDYLVHKVLHTIVEELQRVCEAYRRRLAHFQEEVLRLDPNSRRHNQPLLVETAEINLKVVELQRSVRPMRQLLQHLTSTRDDDCVSHDVKMYVQDTAGELLSVADDLAQAHSMCRTVEEHFSHLVDQAARDSDRQLTDLLSVLTIATTCIAPLQFLCGVYGMNFVHADGTPSIPELRWSSGYLYFWGVCVAWVVVSAACTWRFFARRKRVALDEALDKREADPEKGT